MLFLLLKPATVDASNGLEDKDTTVALQLKTNVTINPLTIFDATTTWGTNVLDCAKEAFANKKPNMCIQTTGRASCPAGTTHKTYMNKVHHRCCPDDTVYPCGGVLFGDNMQCESRSENGDVQYADTFGSCTNECPGGWEHCVGYVCAPPGGCTSALTDILGFSTAWSLNAVINFFGGFAGFKTVIWNQLVGYVEGKTYKHVVTEACKTVANTVKDGKVSFSSMKPSFSDLSVNDFDIFGFNTLFQKLDGRTSCTSKLSCRHSDVKTSSDSKCCGPCSKGEEDYYWCYDLKGSWDYCSPNGGGSEGITSNGKLCRGKGFGNGNDCGKNGEDYNWCYTTPWNSESEWSYCVA